MPQNIPASVVADTFSSARIRAFQTFFKAENQAQCLGALIWHQHVAAAMWPLIGHVEVALRNRLHTTLSGMCSGTWYAGNRNSMVLQPRLQNKADERLNSLRQTLLDMDKTLIRVWDDTLFQHAFMQLTTTNGLYYYMHRTADSGKVLRPLRETRYLAATELQTLGVPRLV